MTAPSVRGWAAATNTADALPAKAITLPTRASGDLLLCFCAGDFTSAITPTGSWTELSDEAGSANRLAIYARIATNDANDALSLAGANNQDFSANVVAVTVNTHGVTDVATDIVCSAAASTGSSGNADPPSQDGGSAKDWLAFAACAVDVTGASQTPTAYPGSYSAGVLQESGNIAGSVALGVGQRQLSATQTENPGTFTNTSNPWVAKTVLVPPTFATVQASADLTFGGLDVAATATVHTPVQASADLTFGALDIQATATAESPPSVPVHVRTYPISGTFGAQGPTGTSFSGTVDCSDGDCLVVFISCGDQAQNTGGISITSITFNGDPLTNLLPRTTNAESATASMFIYYLLAPDQVSGTLAISTSGYVGGQWSSMTVEATVYSGVTSIDSTVTIDNPTGQATSDTMTRSNPGASSTCVGVWHAGTAISSVTAGSRRGDYNNLTGTNSAGNGVVIEGATIAVTWGGTDARYGFIVELVGGGGGPQTIEASADLTWGGLEVTAHIPDTIEASADITWGGLDVQVSLIEVNYPATISGRKWLDQNGNVFLLKTCSSWGCAENLSDADMDTYLTAVAALGFNAVTVSLPGHRGPNGQGWGGDGVDRNPDPDWYGVCNDAVDPFFGNTQEAQWNTATLGAGWASYDHLLAKASELGMCVILSFYTGSQDGSGSPPFGNEGMGPLLEWQYNRIGGATYLATLEDIGEAIATRFAAYPNIIWHLGADKQWTYAGATALAQSLDALFHGIANIEGASPRMRVAEPANDPVNSSVNQWDDDFTYMTPFSADSVYHYSGTAVEVFDYVYGTLAGTLPVWDCEPVYIENDQYTGIDRQQYRERPYTAFLRNGIGINWGHESIYGFDKGDYWGSMTWAQALESVEITEASYIWALVDTYCKDSTWVPDGGTFLTAGVGSGDTKAASGFSDTVAIVYFPNSRAGITVDTTVLSGTGNVRLRWYDPTAGTFSTIAASEAQQSGRSITYNAGTHTDTSADWVLVVDLVGGVNDYTQTITDSIGIQNPFTQESVAQQTFTEPLGMLDSNAKAMTTALLDPVGMLDAYGADTVRPTTDAIGLLDGATQVHAAAQTQTDTVGLLDGHYKDLTTLLTDPLGLLDAPVQETGTQQVLTDPVGLLDSQVQGIGTEQAFTDPLGVLDAAATLVVAQQTLTDPVGVVDTYAADTTRPIVDAVGLLDSTTQETGTQQTLTDPLGLLDDIAQAGGTQQIFTDPMGLLDAASQVLAAASLLTDPIGIVDTTTQTAVVAQSLTDPLGLIDDAAANIDVATAMTDAIGLLDSTAQAGGTQQTFTDVIGGLDSSSGLAVTDRTMTDPVGLLDNETHATPATQTFTDAVGLVDDTTAASAVAAAVTDPLGLTDAPVQESGTQQALTDTVGLLDSRVQAQGWGRERTDPLGLVDAAALASTAVRQADDNLGIVDNLDMLIPAVRSITDLIGLLDDSAGDTGTRQTITDVLGMLDSQALTRDVVLPITDVIGMVDDQAQIKTVVLVLTDTLGMLDDLQLTQTVVIEISDALGLADNALTAQQWAQVITNLVGLSDALSSYGLIRYLIDCWWGIDLTP